MANPYAQYAQPNPYTVFSGGPKAQPGYAPADAPVVPQTYIPGSKEDPLVAARLAAAEARARAAATTPIEVGGRITAANAEAQIDVNKHRQINAIDNAPTPKTPDQLAAAQHDLLNVIDQANKAKSMAGWGATGFTGELLSHVPGTPAYDLSSTLSTVGSNAAFDRLQRMREESKTGGAVGNPSDADIRLLKDSVAALSQGQSDGQFKSNLDTVTGRYRDMYLRLGGDPKAFGQDGSVAVDPYTGQRRDGQAPIVGGGNANGGNGPSPPGGGMPGGGGGTPPIYGPNTPGGTDNLSFAQGATRTEKDPTLAGVNAQVSNMLRAGATADQVRSYLQSLGVDTTKTQGIDDAIGFRAKHPAYRGNYPVNVDDRTVPMTAWRQILNRYGQGRYGAAAMGMADMASLGTVDNLTSNPALARAGMSAVAAAHPYANLAGQMAGGALVGGLGEAGLGAAGVASRVPLAGLNFAPRAVAADALLGGGYGAGSADGGNRVRAGLFGAGLGVAGGAAGRKVTNAVAGLTSPQGGDMASILAEGVKPTIGQRFGRSGVPGRWLNTVEQAVQDVPIVGGTVRGARDASREQFERGGFNNALAEIDHKLPANMPMGTEPHAYAQKAFGDVYDKARSGMQFAPDQQYITDRAAYTADLGKGILSEDQVKRVASILDNAVTSRLQSGKGSLVGDAYKAAVSDIGKASRKLSKHDPLVAEALDDYSHIMDSAARRNSNPDSVALLDKADRGYAKMVRIEMAAGMRGGENATGRYTPAQLQAAAQKASGGVRSRSYLRGDALMGQYADAGRGLSDTLGNSGSFMRGITGVTAMGGAGYINPYAAAASLTGAVPYLPGARNVIGGLMAPTDNASRQAIGSGLRKYKGMFGRGGVPLSIAAQQYLLPAQ